MLKIILTTIPISLINTFLGPVTHKLLRIEFIANYKLLINLFEILSYNGKNEPLLCFYEGHGIKVSKHLNIFIYFDFC